MNECGAALREMHRRLDAGDGPRDTGLERHLGSCAACRERFDELTEMTGALRSLGSPRLGDDARAEILRRTVEAPAALVNRGRFVLRAAAASVLIAALAGALLVVGTPPRDESIQAADLDRAAAEVRLVLGLTTDAIDKSRDTAVREIFQRELRPAIDRLPVIGGRDRVPAPSAEGSS